MAGKVRYGRERETPYDVTYVQKLENKTNEQAHNRNGLMDPKNMLVVDRVARGRGMSAKGEKD